MFSPIGDLAHEEVRGGVHGLDGKACIGGEVHEREPLGLGSREADQVEIFGRAGRREPRRCRRASNEEPVTIERGSGALEDLENSRLIERWHHVLTLRNVMDAWQILRDGGVPLALPGTGQRHGALALARAARTVMTDSTGRDAEALAAWLIAWRDHWPTAFAGAFAADVVSVGAWAESHASDAGRRIKLRRIALENLARQL